MSVEELPKIDIAVQMLLSGLIIMADWIASNTYYFPLIPIDSCGSADLYPQRDLKAWNKLKLPESWSPMSYAMDSTGFEDIFEFAPNAVQSAVIEAVNESADRGGIYVLEAQMGVGKTEAALAAAEVLASNGKCSGVFFGLPTQATANGIFLRLKEWAKNQAEDMRLANSGFQMKIAKGLANGIDQYFLEFT